MLYMAKNLHMDIDHALLYPGAHILASNQAAPGSTHRSSDAGFSQVLPLSAKPGIEPYQVGSEADEISQEDPASHMELPQSARLATGERPPQDGALEQPDRVVQSAPLGLGEQAFHREWTHASLQASATFAPQPVRPFADGLRLPRGTARNPIPHRPNRPALNLMYPKTHDLTGDERGSGIREESMAGETAGIEPGSSAGNGFERDPSWAQFVHWEHSFPVRGQVSNASNLCDPNPVESSLEYAASQVSNQSQAVPPSAQPHPAQPQSTGQASFRSAEQGPSAEGSSEPTSLGLRKRQMHASVTRPLVNGAFAAIKRAEGLNTPRNLATLINDRSEATVQKIHDAAVEYERALRDALDNGRPKKQRRY